MTTPVSDPFGNAAFIATVMGTLDGVGDDAAAIESSDDLSSFESADSSVSEALAADDSGYDTEVYDAPENLPEPNTPSPPASTTSAPITPAFAERYLSGRRVLAGGGKITRPFVASSVIDAYNAACAVYDFGEPLLHDDALHYLSLVPKCAWNVATVCKLELLIEYFVLWLSGGDRLTTRARYLHVSSMLANVLRLYSLVLHITKSKAGSQAIRSLIENRLSSTIRSIDTQELDSVSVDDLADNAGAGIRFYLERLATHKYCSNAARYETVPVLHAINSGASIVNRLILARKNAETCQKKMTLDDYRSVTDRVFPPPDKTCVICLDSLRSGGGVSHRLPCGHAFHPQCLFVHLTSKGTTSTCPCCRKAP